MTGTRTSDRADGGSLNMLWRTNLSTIFSPTAGRARYVRMGAGGIRRPARTAMRTVAAGVALAAAGAVAACGSSPTSSTPTAGTAGGASATISLATSLATRDDSWAVVPVSTDPAFWEVFARAANSQTWRLATPPGAADNGGLIAAVTGDKSLAVAVRPSQDLAFSPLAETANGGGSWSTASPVNGAVAASPDAFSAFGRNLVALLSDGAIETSPNAGTTWSTIAAPGAIAVSPAAKGCGGAVRVTTISFGETDTEVLAGGTCGTSGATAVFAYSAGTGWKRASLPASGRLVRMTGSMALVLGKSGLTAAWRGFGWYAYAPPSSTAAPTNWTTSPALPVSGSVTASGMLAGSVPNYTVGAWVLLSDGRAATISAPGTTSGAARRWVRLPMLPAHTSVLASGPGGALDAFAVSGATVTVWRLALHATAWSSVQAITAPIQYGSSS